MSLNITVLTLGVEDLQRSFEFYTALGLKSKEGIIGTEFEYGAVAFFELSGGLKLALWPKKSIARDTGVSVGAPSATEFTIGYNVASSTEVDFVIELARGCGATIIKEPATTFYGGYAGYFQDPDGHLWDVVWNPGFEANDD